MHPHPPHATSLTDAHLFASQLVPQPAAFAPALATLGTAGEVLLTLAAADARRGAGQRATLHDETQKALAALVKSVREL